MNQVLRMLSLRNLPPPVPLSRVPCWCQVIAGAGRISLFRAGPAPALSALSALSALLLCPLLTLLINCSADPALRVNGIYICLKRNLKL